MFRYSVDHIPTLNYNNESYDIAGIEPSTPTPRSFIRSMINQMQDFQKIFYNYTGLIRYPIPMHKDYIHLSKRLQTFENWPISDTIKPEKIAKSGFFYKGFSDAVTCFHCGVSLAFWKSTDIPDEEHKKYSKTCEFNYFTTKQHPNKSPAICTVCLEEPCHYALTPCGHIAMCHKCILLCNKCPVCVSKITGVLQIFF